MLSRSLIVPIAVVATLAAANASQAATVSKSGDVITLDTSGDNYISNFPAIRDNPQNSSQLIVDSDLPRAETTPSGGCFFAAPLPSIDSRVLCPRDGNDRVVATLGAGIDVLNNNATTSLPMTISGGAGDDAINGGSAPDEIHGGPGGDALFGNGGGDELDGGDAGDSLFGGAGADRLGGGPGFDRTEFSGNAPQVLSIDGVANDGPDGDNILLDVEDVRGGSGDDVITGSAARNDLEGAGGNDVLDGGGDIDAYDLGDGNDRVTARDGLGERIDCGEGDDAVTGDDIDALANCEQSALSGELVRDLDGDGVAKPADCADANPAIRPGAPDVPDNGVDEDCDGVDATVPDRDHDGVARPADCDDANPAIRPGAQEVFGNAIDEDCSGHPDPLLMITSPVLARFVGGAGAARLARLVVRDVEAGTTVELRCRGKHCKFKLRRIAVERDTATLDLRKRAGLRRLGREVLEVRLLRTDSIGKVVRFSGKGGGIPATSVLCLPPGAGAPSRC